MPPAWSLMRVEMIARPINPSDLIPIRGAYRHRIPLPCIPGYEGVGSVIAIGSSVQKSMLGKRACIAPSGRRNLAAICKGFFLLVYRDPPFHSGRRGFPILYQPSHGMDSLQGASWAFPGFLPARQCVQFCNRTHVRSIVGCFRIQAHRRRAEFGLLEANRNGA